MGRLRCRLNKRKRAVAKTATYQPEGGWEQVRQWYKTNGFDEAARAMGEIKSRHKTGPEYLLAVLSRMEQENDS